mgnify:CR=1 FL=1
MSLVEINFDGIVGPSHNYAGLSLGNIASASHKGDPSFPRAAALQGIAKMRGNMERGLAQGFLLPLPRPNDGLLRAIGADESLDGPLLAAAWSWSVAQREGRTDDWAVRALCLMLTAIGIGSFPAFRSLRRSSPWKSSQKSRTDVPQPACFHARREVVDLAVVASARLPH